MCCHSASLMIRAPLPRHLQKASASARLQLTASPATARQGCDNTPGTAPWTVTMPHALSDQLAGSAYTAASCA